MRRRNVGPLHDAAASNHLGGGILVGVRYTRMSITDPLPMGTAVVGSAILGIVPLPIVKMAFLLLRLIWSVLDDAQIRSLGKLRIVRLELTFFNANRWKPWDPVRPRDHPHARKPMRRPAADRRLLHIPVPDGPVTIADVVFGLANVSSPRSRPTIVAQHLVLRLSGRMVPAGLVRIIGARARLHVDWAVQRADTPGSCRGTTAPSAVETCQTHRRAAAEAAPHAARVRGLGRYPR
mmetsp:Transcript_31593/g.69189  ORF Transcript_31593/g.69189 Transcript_31593/m.69189 type:complete len:236 (-) Transcript_31593:182-889(-)